MFAALRPMARHGRASGRRPREPLRRCRTRQSRDDRAAGKTSGYAASMTDVMAPTGPVDEDAAAIEVVRCCTAQ